MGRRPKFRVEWAATARADLDAIVEYVAQRDILAALSVLGSLERTAGRLTAMPLRGRVVPELAAVGVHGYREVMHSPWRIIYRTSGDTVSVLAVVDCRRDLEDLLLERFVR